MKKEEKQALTLKIVEASILLVIGILFCFSNSIGSILSTILGIGIIVAGAAILTIAIITKKSLLNSEGVITGLLISVGIYVIVVNFMDELFGYIPYLMICGGAVLFIDAFLGKFLNKKDNWVLFVIKLVIGLAFVTIGICLLTIDGFKSTGKIIFGVCLILLAVYMAVLIVIEQTKKNKANNKN